jgi:hypothetical protein
MNTLRTVCVCFILLGASARSNGAELLSTNINPALSYYRSFLAFPDFSQEDRDYLFATNWTGQALDQRFGRLISQYGDAFRLLREAAASKVPCDWGIDLKAGPVTTTLNPLAKAKHLAQMDLLDVRWRLQNGQQVEARDDFLAAMALARNLPRVGLQISTLLQLSTEALITRSVAENFYQFSPETLKQIADGFDVTPRWTFAQCLPHMRYLFCEWYPQKIRSFQEGNPGDDSKVLERFRELFARDWADGPESKPTLSDRLIEAGGGTSAGVLRIFSEQAPRYDKLAAIMVLPYSRYLPEMEAFKTEVEKGAGPLAPGLLRWDVDRRREFRILARLAMVRAAVEYRLHGQTGFNSVNDPCGNGPFGFRRFVLEGVDRGFELTCSLKEKDTEVLIFVEKPGTPFSVDGTRVGQVFQPVSVLQRLQQRYGIVPETNK